MVLLTLLYLYHCFDFGLPVGRYYVAIDSSGLIVETSCIKLKFLKMSSFVECFFPLDNVFSRPNHVYHAKKFPLLLSLWKWTENTRMPIKNEDEGSFWNAHFCFYITVWRISHYFSSSNPFQIIYYRRFIQMSWSLNEKNNNLIVTWYIYFAVRVGNPNNYWFKYKLLAANSYPFMGVSNCITLRRRGRDRPQFFSNSLTSTAGWKTVLPCLGWNREW